VAKNSPDDSRSDAEVDALLNAALLAGSRKRMVNAATLKQVPEAVTLLALPKPKQASLVPRLIAQITSDDSTHPKESIKQSEQIIAQNRFEFGLLLLDRILRKSPALSIATLQELLECCIRESYWMPLLPNQPINRLIVTRLSRRDHGLDLDLVRKYEASLRAETRDKLFRRLADQLRAAVEGKITIRLIPGEAWSDQAISDMATLPPVWNDLLIACQEGGRGKYTEKWRKSVQPHLDSIGPDNFKKIVTVWFALVEKPRTQPYEAQNQYMPDQANLILDPHVEILRGLAWCCGFTEDVDFARALLRLAVSAYRKIPGKGPRLVSLGNACVSALAMMPGRTPIGQLAVLKTKVKFGTAQKEVEKAFTAAAEREGLPREEIEELAVPNYGLTEVGRMVETFGDCEATLTVDGNTASLTWTKAGKAVKSAPASVKADFKDDLKELQGSVKDISTMLVAQRERLDGLFLAQATWPLAIWRERYLDHPLVGTLARRLIWSFRTGKDTTTGAWHDGELRDIDGKPLSLPDSTTVSIWHPITDLADDVVAWRDWLEARQIRQPFKQAHREVYLLTDAERRTNTYSNRFAAHIIRQHQFHALATGRGWKDQLRLMVDDGVYPPRRNLPKWNLRAEFWVEGIGDAYGTDTTETGSYLRLVTDQVRFYPHDAGVAMSHAMGGGFNTGRVTAEPIPLEQIPPLVLSEILRDVDLFVGVASVGNDPTWADGGPQGRHRDYWQEYAFGELSATAATRRTILAKLLPRLKIAKQCTLEERFLKVIGKLRTYHIHLGSGNILMEPNDQYLCIVAKPSGGKGEDVFLPFEGDNTLSIILSKAFLLAADDKITDTTITSQIQRS
jgi:Domain of unknown function (DUF4132)